MAATLACTQRVQQAGSTALPIESSPDVAKNTHIDILTMFVPMARAARHSRHSTHAGGCISGFRQRLTVQKPFRSIRLLHP